MLILFAKMDSDATETLPDAVVVDEENSTSSAADKESTTVKAYVDPLTKNFELVDFAKKRYKCAHCDWVSVAPSSRRRLEHLLAKGSGRARACVHARSKLSEGELHDLQIILDAMDNVATTKRRSTEMSKAATESLTLPKRQKKLSSFLNQVDKDKMDLSYARMIFMSAVKATFLDSPFTKDFFMVSVCVCVCECVGPL